MDLDYLEKVKENQQAAEERTAKRRKKRCVVYRFTLRGEKKKPSSVNEID